MADSPGGRGATEGSFWVVEEALEVHPRLGKHAWAVRIVFRHFRDGLLRLTASHEMKRRYREFLGTADPIYGSILKGLEDTSLASTFVSYWKIAHTMATQSRFWLEDAIAEIVEHDPAWQGRKRKVYNGRMLGAGLYEQGRTLFDLGEEEREAVLSNRRPWRVPVQRAAIEAVDRIVGDQELSERSGPKEGWDSEEAVRRDRALLGAVADSLVGPPPTYVNLHCNLLVVEPDRLDEHHHVWAFRFVNPNTFSSHAVRKQERVNLLRLYAYLAQEKPLRDPKQLHVSVAEVVPRPHQPVGVSYFSSHTYWHAERFWGLLGVPFEAVQLGIGAAGSVLGEQLREGLRGLLPVEPKEGNSTVPEKANDPPISAARAQEIAVSYILQNADGAAARINSVVAWDEIDGRKPTVYGKPDGFWKHQWIVYVDCGPVGIRSSYIVAVDQRTGDVSYSGSANDEG